MDIEVDKGVWGGVIRGVVIQCVPRSSFQLAVAESVDRMRRMQGCRTCCAVRWTMTVLLCGRLHLCTFGSCMLGFDSACLMSVSFPLCLCGSS